MDFSKPNWATDRLRPVKDEADVLKRVRRDIGTKSLGSLFFAVVIFIATYKSGSPYLMVLGPLYSLWLFYVGIQLGLRSYRMGKDKQVLPKDVDAFISIPSAPYVQLALFMVFLVAVAGWIAIPIGIPIVVFNLLMIKKMRKVREGALDSLKKERPDNNGTANRHQADQADHNAPG